MTATITRMPGARPFLGHALRFKRHPLEFLREVHGHGDVVEVRLGPTSAYVVNDIALIRQILIGEPHKYDKGIQYDQLKPMFGNGLSSSAGEFHQRQRRLMQPSFHRAQLAGYTERMTEIAVPIIESWQDGQVVKIDRELRLLALQIVGQTLFSTDIGAKAIAEFERSLSFVLRGVEDRMMSPLKFLEKIPTRGNREFNSALAAMHRVVSDVIGEYRSTTVAGTDLLSTLLLARDEDGDGAGMTDEQIHDEVMTLMVSGFETTATALAWVAHLLASHPAAQRRVQDEVDRVLNGRAASYDDLRDLDYLHRVLTETSRIYPCIPMMTRRTLEDVTLGRHVLPTGSAILIPTHPVHHNAELFVDPEAFDPDRWLPERRGDLPREAYLAFSLGVRGCIGERFAKAEMAIILSTIMASWTLRPAPAAEVRTLVKATIVPSSVDVVVRARRR